jgi:hypothetical protein
MTILDDLNRTIAIFMKTYLNLKSYYHHLHCVHAIVLGQFYTVSIVRIAKITKIHENSIHDCHHRHYRNNAVLWQL